MKSHGNQNIFSHYRDLLVHWIPRFFLKNTNFLPMYTNWYIELSYRLLLSLHSIMTVSVYPSLINSCIKLRRSVLVLSKEMQTKIQQTTVFLITNLLKQLYVPSLFSSLDIYLSRELFYLSFKFFLCGKISSTILYFSQNLLLIDYFCLNQDLLATWKSWQQWDRCFQGSKIEVRGGLPFEQ